MKQSLSTVSIRKMFASVVMIILALSSWLAMAWPHKEIDSREYKTMITAAAFNGNPPCETNPTALSTLTTDLSRFATAVGIPSMSGSFSLKSGMPRTVKYYDTAGDCRLYNNDFIFRMRQKTGKTDWKGTMKFRHGDRYFSSYRGSFLDSCHATEDLGGKFEEDLNFSWQPTFSYSHKCKISHHKDIETLQDIADTWNHIDKVFEKELGWTLTDPIAMVGNLQVTECVYEGLVLDFDNDDDDAADDMETKGEVSVSLWYDSNTNRLDPALAELSFRVYSSTGRGGGGEDWNLHTIVNAHKFWNQLGHNLTQVDPNSSTKTAWVYNYDPTWCVIQTKTSND